MVCQFADMVKRFRPAIATPEFAEAERFGTLLGRLVGMVGQLGLGSAGGGEAVPVAPQPVQHPSSHASGGGVSPAAVQSAAPAGASVAALHPAHASLSIPGGAAQLAAHASMQLASASAVSPAFGVPAALHAPQHVQHGPSHQSLHIPPARSGEYSRTFRLPRDDAWRAPPGGAYASAHAAHATHASHGSGHPAGHGGSDIEPEPPPRVLRDHATILRDVHEVEREVEKLLAVTDTVTTPDCRLLTLKSLACRQRGLFDELQMQRLDDSRARELYGMVKDATEKIVPRTSEPQPFQYVMPLDTRVSPRHPADWYEASRRYADLVECLPGLEWVVGTVGYLSDMDKKEVLEPIAARQQRLYRWLQHRFHTPGQDSISDPQQGALFGRLREYARSNSIFLIGLNGQTDEGDLQRLAEQLTPALERQQARVRRRREQDELVTKIQTTVGGPKFGSREQHGDLLRVMVRRALDAGVPPTHSVLRDTLVDWVHLLGGDEKISKLVSSIEVEKRRRQARQEAADAESRETPLEPARVPQLNRVLPVVKGTRMVMIGGLCREDNRKALQDALQLAELVWPDTNGRESVYDFEPLVAHPDTRVVLLLIRFMRTGFGRVAELCRKHGKHLVRLPAGYGLNQVVHNLCEQIVPGGDGAHPISDTPVTATVERSGDSAGDADDGEGAGIEGTAEPVDPVHREGGAGESSDDNSDDNSDDTRADAPAVFSATGEGTGDRLVAAPAGPAAGDKPATPATAAAESPGSGDGFGAGVLGR